MHPLPHVLAVSLSSTHKKREKRRQGGHNITPTSFLSNCWDHMGGYRTPPFCFLLLSSSSFFFCGINPYKVAIYCKRVANCGCAYTFTCSLWSHNACAWLVCLILSFGLGLTLITTVMARLLIRAGLEETG